MKELKDIDAGAKGSKFAALTAQLPADTALAIFAGNTGAMVAGHVGIIEKFDWLPTQGGSRVPDITQDQVIQILNETVLLQAYEPNVPKKPLAVTAQFSTGRTMTLGLIMQGQEKTKFTFADGKVIKATDLNLGNLDDLVGKKWKCEKYFRDTTNPIVRSNPNAEREQDRERSYAANCYEFKEVA